MGDRYPNDWNSRKRKVKRRDSYTCQNCGSKGGDKKKTTLHVHHIVPISDGGTHKKSNLKTLCEDCHNAIHHNDKSAPTEQDDRSVETKRELATRTSNYGNNTQVTFDDVVERIHPNSKPPSTDPFELFVNKIKETLGYTSETEEAIVIVRCSNCGTKYENQGHEEYLCPSCYKKRRSD